MPDQKKPNDDGKPVDQFLAEAVEIMTAAGWIERYRSDVENTAVQYTEHGEQALKALWLAFGDLFPHGLTKDSWWGAAFVATLKFGPPKE